MRRDIEPVALAGLAVLGGEVAVRQPDHQRRRGVQGGVLRDEVVVWLYRLAVRIAAEPQVAAERDIDDLRTAVARVRPILSEVRDRDHDEVGAQLDQRVVVEAARGEVARLEALDQRIALGDQRTQQRLPLDAVEVNHQAALGSVQMEVACADLEPGLVVRERWPAAQRIAVRRLDLDHVRAEPGKQAPGVTETAPRQVEDAHPVEDPAHLGGAVLGRCVCSHRHSRLAVARRDGV